MTRLVGITLVLNGNSDGTNIYPGVRKIAAQAGLSERAVSTHIDRLVRRGLLSRKARGGDTAGARGFEYTLLRPEVLNQIQHGAPVLKIVQHSVERSAAGVEPDDSSVLNHVQPTSPIPVHIPAGDARADEGALPARTTARSRSHRRERKP
jgi:DNA-binding transcriptional ArsR family regulator